MDVPNVPPGPYSIGSDHWPGLSKLVEELGELQQVLGKIVGANGAVVHFDGSNLRDRLRDEAGDVHAALVFFLAANGFDREEFLKRSSLKHATFTNWHNNAQKD